MYKSVPERTEVFHDLIRSRDPDCEDDEMQAETRKTRSLSVAVEFESMTEAAVSTRQLDPKVVLIGVTVLSGLIAKTS